MSGPEFFQTRMGQIFFESTMPRIAQALEQLVGRGPADHKANEFLNAWMAQVDAREEHIVAWMGTVNDRLSALTDRMMMADRRAPTNFSSQAARRDADHPVSDATPIDKERMVLLTWFAKCELAEYSTGALDAAYKALVEFEE